MRVVHHNVRGLNQAKYDFYDDQLNNNEADIIFIAESWHNNSIRKSNNFLYHSPSSAARIRWGSAGRTRLPGGILLLARQTLHHQITIQRSIFNDSIAMTFEDVNIACVYLPPSMTQEHRFSTLWRFADFDVIVGDINIRLHGGNKSSKECRDGLAHFAEECHLELHPSQEQLDHVISRRSLIEDLTYSHTTLSTDHMQQRFSIRPQSFQFSTAHVEYQYPSAFFRLSPLLNVESQSVFSRMLCDEYDLRQDLISLSIEQQRGLLFVGAINAQDAVDCIDELLVRTIHDVQMEILERAQDRKSDRQAPQATPQCVSAATRLFKSLKKPTKTIIKSDTEGRSAAECVRDRYETLWSDSKEVLQSTITEELQRINLNQRNETKRIIRAYNTTKSAGGDGIHIVVMKALLASSFPDHLTSLYDLITELGKTPTRWNTAITTLISKREDGAPCLPTEVRPISLTVMFRRIFERLVLTELERITVLHPSQFGFKQGSDTLTNVLTVDAAKERGVRNRTITDFATAYDSTRWRLLKEKLRKAGVGQMLLTIITNLMFKEMYSILVVNGDQVRRIRLCRGLFQGSLLSPILFNIFANDLLDGLYERFARSSNELPAVMYADDLILLWTTVEEALELWIYLQEWTQQNNMELKLSKCSYLTLGERHELLENIGLKLRTSHKHLGIEMTARGFNWPVQVIRTVTKAKNVIQMLRRFCYSWSTPIKIQLIKTFALPIINYAMPIMAADASKALANSNVECCLSHGTRIAKGFLRPEWLALESVITLSHKFILGVKVHPKLAAAVTAIESASTRAVELSMQMSMIQLRFIAPDNPFNTINSAIKRWLNKSHEMTRSFPSHLPPVSRKMYKPQVLSSIRKQKSYRLSKYYPTNHPVPDTHRIRTSLIDKILTTNNASLEKHLLFWRGNQFGRGQQRICVCLEPFTQSHTITCAERAGIVTLDVNKMIEENQWEKLELTLGQWWTLINH
jgi:hypothetical protein